MGFSLVEGAYVVIAIGVLFVATWVPQVRVPSAFVATPIHVYHHTLAMPLALVIKLAKIQSILVLFNLYSFYSLTSIHVWICLLVINTKLFFIFISQFLTLA